MRVRNQQLKFWLFMVLFFVCALFVKKAFASDYHQNDQKHKIVYVLSNGSIPVTGQTISLAVQRASDSKFLDFSDGTFKSSSWTSRLATMSYDSTGGYYGYDLSINAGNIVSGDYVCIISNDDVTYSDLQAEVVSFDNLSKLIKIQR